MKTTFNGDKFKVTSGFELLERPDHHGIDLVGLDNITVISPITALWKAAVSLQTSQTQRGSGENM